jgi:hypothetical protein
MKTFFLRFFTWWNGATFGTLVWTSLYGEFVGEDEFGNRYYRAAVVAWLAASYGRHAADAGEGHTAAVVEAAPAQSHRHARRPSPDRFDTRARAPAEGDRRLQGLDAGQITGAGVRIGSAGRVLTAGCDPERPFPRRILGVNRRSCPQVSEQQPRRWPDCFASPA